MSFLAGAPSFVACLAIVYLVAESGSRWVALVAAAGLACGLLVALRREVQAGTEDPAPLTNGAERSDLPR